KILMGSTCVPQDNSAFRFPVSVKGVVIEGGQVILLKNERDEWELPGGKLELGEPPETCVAREIEEELGILVVVGPILDSWVYHIHEGVDVLIITYGCHPPSSFNVVRSGEHKAAGVFALDDVKTLRMPQGYKKSIESWAKVL